MTEDDSDRVYIERCLAGDQDAFGTLVERYQRQVFRAVFYMVESHEDAQEVSQQVFMKAFEHLARFDRERKFFSWIYRIAMNEAMNFVAARKPSHSLDETLADGAAGPAERFETREQGQAIRQLVLALKPEYRAVLILRHFLNCSYAETAELLDVPEKTVKSRLFTARQLLRDSFIARASSGTRRG